MHPFSDSGEDQSNSSSVTMKNSTPCRKKCNIVTTTYWMGKKLETVEAASRSKLPLNENSSNLNCDSLVSSSFSFQSPKYNGEYSMRYFKASSPVTSSPLGSCNTRCKVLWENDKKCIHLARSILEEEEEAANTRGNNDTDMSMCKSSVLSYSSLLVTSSGEIEAKVGPSCSISNPFESDLLRTIHLPSFSPSVFSRIETTSNDSDKPFHWSVDEMAVLYPANIEFDMTRQQENMTEIVDQETEAKVQKAIDEFFSQHDLPSPWVPNSVKSKSQADTPLSNKCSSSDEFSVQTERNLGLLKKDACSQTTLTLPIAIDLEKLLAQYYTYSQPEEKDLEVERLNESLGHNESNASSVDILSATSLRRKLFVGDLDGSIESLPYDLLEENDEDSKNNEQHQGLNKSTCNKYSQSPFCQPLALTPIKTPLVNYCSPISDTPNSAQTSSPIMYRTSLTPSSFLTPPLCSPIQKLHSSIKSRSSPIISEPMVCSPSITKSSNVIKRHEVCSKLPLGFLNSDFDYKILKSSNCFTDIENEAISNKYVLEDKEPLCVTKWVDNEPMSIDHSDLKTFSYMEVSEAGSNNYSNRRQRERDTGYQTGSLQSTNPEIGNLSSFNFKNNKEQETIFAGVKGNSQAQLFQSSGVCLNEDKTAPPSNLSWIHFQSSTPAVQQMRYFEK